MCEVIESNREVLEDLAEMDLECSEIAEKLLEISDQGE